MKLYRSSKLPRSWVGEDDHGALVSWPRQRLGWLQRTPYDGRRDDLEEVNPALARGTRWPGAGDGRPRRSDEPTKNVTLRASPSERAAWRAAAGDLPLGTWAVQQLNAAAERWRSRKGK